jgi:hypothetical protein
MSAFGTKRTFLFPKKAEQIVRGAAGNLICIKEPRSRFWFIRIRVGFLP